MATPSTQHIDWAPLCQSLNDMKRDPAMIVCCGFVGMQNNPLYLRTFPRLDPEQTLKFHYIIHCALDAVEEKVLFKRAPGEVPDTYLGLLYPTEEYKVYGYISNSHVKLILVLDDATAKDELVSRVMRRLYAMYVDTTSNPFHTFGLPISSHKFEKQVEAIVAAYGRPATGLPQA